MRWTGNSARLARAYADREQGGRAGRLRSARRRPMADAQVHEHEPPYVVGYFVGSLARDSLNRRLSRALVRLAPEDLQLQEVPIGDLPLYSWDYDADFPPVAREFKQAIAGTDAVLFITPEYNR